MFFVGFSDCADEGAAVDVMDVEVFRYLLYLAAAVGVQPALEGAGDGVEAGVNDGGVGFGGAGGYIRAFFQHNDGEIVFCKLICGHRAGYPRADNGDVVDLSGISLIV